HTHAHMAWEYATAWPALADGGLLLSDDVFWSTAFWRFARQVKTRGRIVRGMGFLRKPGSDMIAAGAMLSDFSGRVPVAPGAGTIGAGLARPSRRAQRDLRGADGGGPESIPEPQPEHRSRARGDPGVHRRRLPGGAGLARPGGGVLPAVSGVRCRRGPAAQRGGRRNGGQGRRPRAVV